MAAIHAASALLPEGWRANVRVSLAHGRISAIEPDAAPQPADERHAVLLPGMSNVHSHAFQRGMAGLSEARGLMPGHAIDSFWSWRELMYRFALGMTPDHVRAVAAQLYMEMLEAGFSRVGEFHYLHHGPDGSPYDNISEMATQIAAAAQETSIRLTMLPVFYAHADFGSAPPIPGQRRFVTPLDDFARLVEGCAAAINTLPGSTMGVAPHSLRAVTLEELGQVTQLAPSGPIHMHVAEQMGEVNACIAATGARPMELLLDNAEVDARWCLIHATHMTEAETARLARSGAVAGLCPITEANLGDGIFAAQAFFSAGGSFAIGSDSNIQIGISDELRQLEYAQRLLHQIRNVTAQGSRSTGRTLFDGALQGGRTALQGLETGLQTGGAADFFSLDKADAQHLSEDTLLDGWIFAKAAQVDCVWIGGRKCVQGGRHVERARISRQFAATLQEMMKLEPHDI